MDDTIQQAFELGRQFGRAEGKHEAYLACIDTLMEKMRASLTEMKMEREKFELATPKMEVPK